MTVFMLLILMLYVHLYFKQIFAKYAAELLQESNSPTSAVIMNLPLHASHRYTTALANEGFTLVTTQTHVYKSTPLKAASTR